MVFNYSNSNSKTQWMGTDRDSDLVKVQKISDYELLIHEWEIFIIVPLPKCQGVLLGRERKQRFQSTTEKLSFLEMKHKNAVTVVACTRYSQDQVNQNPIIYGRNLIKPHSYLGSYSKM